jgi:hypothetical protein
VFKAILQLTLATTFSAMAIAFFYADASPGEIGKIIPYAVLGFMGVTLSQARHSNIAQESRVALPHKAIEIGSFIIPLMVCDASILIEACRLFQSRNMLFTAMEIFGVIVTLNWQIPWAIGWWQSYQQKYTENG